MPDTVNKPLTSAGQVQDKHLTDAYPTYCVSPLQQSAEDADRHVLMLQLNTKIDLQGQVHGIGDGHAGYRQVAPEQFARARDSALESGLHFSAELWQALNKLAEAVLVENFERSRSGAGGR